MKTMRIAILGALLGCLLLCAAPVSAQTFVVNPNTIEWASSADHNLVVGGTAVVTRYELLFFLPGAPAPFTRTDLGKPTPNGTGTIALTRADVFLPLPVGEFTAKLATIGPGGETLSVTSDSFGKIAAPAASSAPVFRKLP